MGWLSRKWVQVILVWSLVATALSIAAIIQGSAPTVGGDDAMRLVQALDLFNGQSWFDITQYRDNAPFGASMHWSRLIDAPLVGLIALFSPIAHDAAPYWVAFVWPLVVLVAAIALLAELTEELAGPAVRLPVLFLFALAIAAYTEFMPGRVDHHNVQILLTLGMILASLRGRYHTGWAIAAGLFAATGLAIGTEVLPSVVVTLTCFSLYWLVDPQGSRPRVLAFAASFPAALLLHMLAAMPIQTWFLAVCDALSLTYLVAAICYAAAMLVAVQVASNLTTPVRFAVLAVLGTLSVAVVLWLFPECRNGPYGNLDPVLAEILMPDIDEAQPALAWASEMWVRTGLLVLPVLGTLGVLLVALLAPADQRWRWLVLVGFTLALFVVFVLQVRGFRILSVVILPAPAWLLWQVWKHFRMRQTLAAAALVMATALTFMGAAHWALFTRAYAHAEAMAPDTTADWAPVSPEATMTTCEARSAYEPLAALPPGRMMSYLLIGARLLLETPHSIVSAGYHRNEAGLRDMVRFFGGGEAEARAVAAERRLDYLVFCRGLPPSDALFGVPEFQGLSWSWLVPISPPEAPIQIYAIDLSR